MMDAVLHDGDALAVSVEDVDLRVEGDAQVTLPRHAATTVRLAFRWEAPSAGALAAARTCLRATRSKLCCSTPERPDNVGASTVSCSRGVLEGPFLKDAHRQEPGALLSRVGPA